MSSNYFCDGELGFLGTFDLSFAPQLLFYSFVPTIVLSLSIGLFILVKDKYSLQSAVLFILTTSFCLWSLVEIWMWITVPVNLNYFGWQLVPLLQILIPISALYFGLIFSNGGNDIKFLHKLLLSITFISVVLLLPTTLNTNGFDAYVCEALVGPLIDYVHILSILITLFLGIFILFKIFTNKSADLKTAQLYRQRTIVLSGVFVFLLIYSSGVSIGEETKTYVIGLVGPIGMLALLTSLTYIIVRFKAFNIKLAGAQALVAGLVVLVGSQLFFVETKTNYILVSVTLFFTILGGFFLIRSVLKEIRQREQLEVLTKQLEAANVRLKELDKAKSEFVSIASHQLRSPLTSIRGYASMLAEGSFGKLTQKAQEAAARIEESAKLMAMSVEDYLNVSRIESGNMKYNLTDFNLRDMANKICEDLRPDAMKHNLILLFRTNLSSRGIVNADVGKTNQIVHNLINNSIKYTPKGTINVFMRDDLKKKKIYIEITDTGIGMSQETIAKLFNKFTRADNANSVNVSGTGLGLFVALKMAEQMGGNISAQSEGDTKGSTFTFELPLAM